MYEWAYLDISRRIVCEKVIQDENDKILMNLKI